MPQPYLSLWQGSYAFSHRERQLVQYLATHAGYYVPSAELAEHIYGFGGTPALVRDLVWRIRRKNGPRIEAARQFGYRLAENASYSLARFCTNCSRDVTVTGRDWTCYGCGASGTLPHEEQRMTDIGDGRLRVECYTCKGEIVRSARKVAYEQERARAKRGVEPRVFCSLDCSRRWRRRE